MSDALRRIAKILGEAEFRLLSELEWSAPKPPHVAGSSNRQLAEATGLSLSNVRKARDSLVSRGLIATDGGTATRASSYRLLYLETAVLPEPQVLPGREPIAGSPPVKNHDQVSLFQAQGEPFSGSEVSLLQAHVLPGREPIAGSPPNEESATSGDRSKERAAARASSNYSTSIQVLDRVLKSNVKKLDDELVAKARSWLWGYRRSIGGQPDAHPPDQQVIAWFLAIASWTRLEALLNQLAKPKGGGSPVKPGDSYMWFVAVALDRLWGVKFEDLLTRRADLQLVGKPKPALAEQQPLVAREPDEVQEPIDDLREAIANFDALRAAAAITGGRR